MKFTTPAFASRRLANMKFTTPAYVKSPKPSLEAIRLQALMDDDPPPGVGITEAESLELANKIQALFDNENWDTDDANQPGYCSFCFRVLPITELFIISTDDDAHAELICLDCNSRAGKQ